MSLFKLIFLSDAFDFKGKTQEKQNIQEHRASRYSNVQTILCLTAQNIRDKGDVMV